MTTGADQPSGDGEDLAGPHPDRRRLERPLPEAVRARVVAIAAECLGAMPAEQLPPALKRVATFAAPRRAKLAANQIAAVVDSDDAFRERLAVQVRAHVPLVAEAVESGTPPAAVDPEEVAAVAYLLRPESWIDLVEGALEATETERHGWAARQAEEQVDRLRGQLDEAQGELRTLRERSREQLAVLKAENAELRRKLGDARTRAKVAEDSAAQAQKRAEEAVASATALAATVAADTRRLRSRIAQLEQEVATARRADRTEKGEGTLRARLLLDTLLDTVQGLRRELALPPVEGAPADSVEADVAEHGARTPSGHGSLGSDDPAMLDQLLGIPRVHLIVDGYNVTKESWPESSLEVQRDRLLAQLAPLAARTQAEVTVVFDAADRVERPLVKRPRGVRVLYSPHGVIADDVIRELVAAEPQGRPVVVVTSDQAVAADVRRDGARVAASRALSRLLGRS